MAIFDFKQWLNKKHEDFSPASMFDFNNEVGEDYEKVQGELTKVLMSKYHDRFLKFIEDLGNEHHDDELRTLKRRLSQSGSNKKGKPKSPFSSHDSIVPPMADRGMDTNTED